MQTRDKSLKEQFYFSSSIDIYIPIYCLSECHLGLEKALCQASCTLHPSVLVGSR